MLFLGVIGGLVLAAICVLLLPLLGGLLGGLSGWLFGYWFPIEAGILIQYLHVPATAWQLGVMLGFFGGFFKAYTYVEKK